MTTTTRHTQGWFVLDRQARSLYRHADAAFKRGDDRMGRMWTMRADAVKRERDRLV